MILLYQLNRSDDWHIGVIPYTMEIRKGDRLSGTPYPCRIDNLLKFGTSGISLTPLDKRILMMVQMHQKLNGFHSYFNGADAGRVLELLFESGRAYRWGNRVPPIRKGKPIQAKMEWRLEGEVLKTTFALPPGWELLPSRPPMALSPDSETCHVLNSGNSEDAAWGWLAMPPLSLELAPEHLRRLEQRFPNALFPVPPGLKSLQRDDFCPVPALRIVGHEESTADALRLRPIFLYGDREIAPGDEGRVVRFKEGDALVDAPRNREFESAKLAQFCATGFMPCPPRAANLFDHAVEKTCYQPDPAAGLTWSLFLEKHLPELQREGWQLLEDPQRRLHRPGSDAEYREFGEQSRGWFSYEQGVVLEGVRINLLPLVQRFLRERRDWDSARIRDYLQTHDISVAIEKGFLILPGPRFLGIIEHIFELFGADVLDKQDRLRLGLWRAAELAAHLGAEGWQPPEELLHSIRAIGGGRDLLPLAAPKGFKGELRPYQEQGLSWLDFLFQHRIGGILADDMGLGKTVQVIAALQHWREQDKSLAPALIVCPASVLPNWRHELERFAPRLRVHSLHGAERHDDRIGLKKAQVLLTTYGTLRVDIERYQSLPLSVVVFDEAQVLKNPRASQTQAAAAIVANVRIALSGTPVENHLGDLWSLFHLLLPGFLGTEREFKHSFRIPIERDRCRASSEALRNRVRPLLLRRSKDSVAPELPPKTEIIQTLPLGQAQADLYQSVLLTVKEELQSEIQAKGFQRSQTSILDALTKLRQTCCDPRLREPSRAWKLPEDSVKIAWLRDNLPGLIEDGRRVLVFSFFTSMLDLVRPELKRMKIPFVEIRGETRDRDTPVRTFQAGKAPLFLLSLKAGGLGLNLTAADTVILLDPWWNPAAEAQAMDRAHRIGQDKPVFVYKLVTEGTVEARILEMQSRKREWAKLVEDAALESPSFSEEDLENLLSPPA
jgi:superfamily II DNA or RNA helicase